MTQSSTETCAVGPNPYDYLPPAASFTLTSNDVQDGQTVPSPQLSQAFGVVSENGDISPHLSWHGFPSDTTRSFVVTCYDPDAPTVSGFWHWIVYDIPSHVTELPTNAGAVGGAHLPEGAKMLQNDAGMAGFLGAAPPPGHPPHRYIYCVSALPVETLADVTPDTTPSVCHFHMFGVGVLGRAFLTTHYGR
jgi:Raf kinase inhibitor-like YbhB/YbcL family protein